MSYFSNDFIGICFPETMMSTAPSLRRELPRRNEAHDYSHVSFFLLVMALIMCRGSEVTVLSPRNLWRNNQTIALLRTCAISRCTVMAEPMKCAFPVMILLHIAAVTPRFWILQTVDQLVLLCSPETLLPVMFGPGVGAMKSISPM